MVGLCAIEGCRLLSVVCSRVIGKLRGRVLISEEEVQAELSIGWLMVNFGNVTVMLV